jgi:hypothetical protein
MQKSTPQMAVVSLLLFSVPAVSATEGTLACAVVACTGAALSTSGLATLVDPSWRVSRKDSRRERKDAAADKRKEAHLSLQPAVGGLALVSWGVVKLAVLRSAPNLVHDLARVNLVVVMALWLRNGKRLGRWLPGLPERAVSILAGLYACIGLGLKGIPRPGSDRFPDRFLTHVMKPGAPLHLA